MVKKSEKKQKKQKKIAVAEKEEDEKSETESVSMDAELDEETEKMIAMLQQKESKKPTSKKIMEKKVMDFKFRVLDLIDIFMRKTNNPILFIESIIPFIEQIKDNMNDKTKDQFQQKLCAVIKKFVERNTEIQPEYQDNVDQCIEHILKIMEKIPSKSIFKTFKFIVFSLLQVRLKMNKKEKTQVSDHLLKFFQESLKKFCTLKHSAFGIEFFKDFMKQFPAMGSHFFETFLEYSKLQSKGGVREANRKNVVNMFCYMLQLPSMQEYIKEKIQNSQEEIAELTVQTFQNYNEIKKKKYSDLKKYSEITLKTLDVLQKKQAKQFKEKIKQPLEEVTDSDKQFKSVKDKILEKINSLQQS